MVFKDFGAWEGWFARVFGLEDWCATPKPRCTVPIQSPLQFLHPVRCDEQVHCTYIQVHRAKKKRENCCKFPLFASKCDLHLVLSYFEHKEVFNTNEHLIYTLAFNFSFEKTHFSKFLFTLFFKNSVLQFRSLFVIWWTNAWIFLFLLQELECRSLARWPGLHFRIYYI